MIVFGWVECWQWFDFGDDGIVLDLVCFEIGDQFVCNFGLFFIMGEDGRVILSVVIVVLMVECGWVVNGEEGDQQCVIVDYVWVEGNLCDFCMVGGVGVDVFVGWVVSVVVGVVRNDFIDIVELVQ